MGPPGNGIQLTPLSGLCLRRSHLQKLQRFAYGPADSKPAYLKSRFSSCENQILMYSLSLLKVTVHSGPQMGLQNNLHALLAPHPMALLLSKCLFNPASFSIPNVITSPLGYLRGLLINCFTSGPCSSFLVYTLPLACFWPPILLPCGP